MNLLLGLAIAAGIAVLPAFILGRSRTSYLTGLLSSVAASLAVSFAAFVAPQLLEADHSRLSTIYVSPLVEETVRLAGLLLLLRWLAELAPSRFDGLAFGLAWGALELCLTWLDLAAEPSRPDAGFAGLYDVVSPLGPLAMSASLSAIAFLMIRRRARLTAVFAIVSTVHILNNASVFAWDYTLPAEYQIAPAAVRLVAFSTAAWLFCRD